MSKPNILFLDIETKPAQAYVWRLFDENVGVEQIIDAGGIICVGMQWSGFDKPMFVSEWRDGKQAMLEAVHLQLMHADAVVTYNGAKFDLPKLNGEFLLYGLPPIPPVTHIDVYKAVRKMGIISNKLAFVGPYLGLGKKKRHEGFRLWKDVMDGKEKAQREMEKYCLQDVKLLVKLYNKIKPYISNHPHLGLTKGAECGACGSNHLQSRGYRRTKAFRIQRLHCQSCGSWQDGKREKMTP